MEELYSHIFSMEGVPQHPPYHGFSYGILIVEDGKPISCVYFEEYVDQKMQYILSNGTFQVFSQGKRKTEIYYGYVTDGSQFFCEETVYPRES